MDSRPTEPRPTAPRPIEVLFAIVKLKVQHQNHTSANCDNNFHTCLLPFDQIKLRQNAKSKLVKGSQPFLNS